MRLIYDNATRATYNVPGVSVRVPEWARPNSVEWIDPNVLTRNLDFGAYFTTIVDSLLTNGYERMTTLFGAPYDFRRGPSECEDPVV